MIRSHTAQVAGIRIGAGRPLAVIAGPCVLESEEHTMRLAEAITDICSAHDVPLIFKASFDKANRSSGRSYRGPGIKEGLRMLARVRQEYLVPILSDIHEPSQAEPAGEVLDCVQIPAFLCRQTDLLLAAAKTGRCVNVKKGQFMASEEMEQAVAKLSEGGCHNVLLTERGTFFGYHRLVNDMTSIPKMQRFAPVVFDATHSCQMPGAEGNRSGGQREYAQTLALAAVAAGADALFMEVHDDPDHAKSDPATVYPLHQFSALLSAVAKVARLVRDPAFSMASAVDRTLATS